MKCLDFYFRFPSFQVLALGQMVSTVLILYFAKAFNFVTYPPLSRDTFSKVRTVRQFVNTTLTVTLVCHFSFDWIPNPLLRYLDFPVANSIPWECSHRPRWDKGTFPSHVHSPQEVFHFVDHGARAIRFRVSVGVDPSAENNSRKRFKWESNVNPTFICCFCRVKPSLSVQFSVYTMIGGAILAARYNLHLFYKIKVNS